MCWEQSHTTGTDLCPFSLHLWLFTSALSFPRLWSTLRYAPSHPKSHRERPYSSESLGKSEVITEVNHWTLLNSWGAEPRFKKQYILTKMRKTDREKALLSSSKYKMVYVWQPNSNRSLHPWLATTPASCVQRQELSVLVELTRHQFIAWAQLELQQNQHRVFCLNSATALLHELNYSLQASCSLFKWKE